MARVVLMIGLWGMGLCGLSAMTFADERENIKTEMLRLAPDFARDLDIIYACRKQPNGLESQKFCAARERYDAVKRALSDFEDRFEDTGMSREKVQQFMRESWEDTVRQLLSDETQKAIKREEAQEEAMGE